MERISVPVTWYHGRHDGWMELDRVRSLMEAGNSGHRRLIEIPTGHQMRSSSEALETFQVISEEVIRMATGLTARAPLPDLDDLERRISSERRRRPSPKIDLPDFWRDYLLGRNNGLGFDLLAATTAYQDLMKLQIDQLRLKKGAHILDLGSGNGDFCRSLAKQRPEEEFRVTQLDLVPKALSRTNESPLRTNSIPNRRSCREFRCRALLDTSAPRYR